MTPFKFLQPEPYLKAWILARSSRHHSMRDRIARQMDWNPSRISRILTGRARLKPEEARRLNALMNHTPEESAYFLALTQWGWTRDRAKRVRLSDEMVRIRTQAPVPPAHPPT